MNVLFVCTLNLQRSPTAERIFREMCNNKDIDATVKSAGVSRTAKTVVTGSVVDWADRIYVMEDFHEEIIRKLDPEADIINLKIPDVYVRNDPELASILKEKLSEEMKNF